MKTFLALVVLLFGAAVGFSIGIAATYGLFLASTALISTTNPSLLSQWDKIGGLVIMPAALVLLVIGVIFGVKMAEKFCKNKKLL